MILTRLQDLLNEAISNDKVIADGRMSKRRSSTKDGYKIVTNGSGTEEIKMSLEEKMEREKAAKKTAIRNAHRRNLADKRRDKSIKYHRKIYHGSEELDESKDTQNEIALGKIDNGIIGSGI